ncbi:MAG: thioredoxin fold domain-containing protein [Chloroflexi bacterium]|nr:thioredoxin fold domain-containing protein [Chloroflexota bacterium]
MMKQQSLLFITLLALIFCESACSVKKCQTAPTPSETLVIEIIPASSTPKLPATSTPSPSVTPSQEIVTELYPGLEILNGNSAANETINPYPMTLQGTQTPGDVQPPYPGPDSLQLTQNSVSMQQPYPGLDNPPSDFDDEIGFNNTYPPPGGGLVSNPTQPIAINPIQTPMVTLAETNNATGKPTSTAIVRTSLRATDPKSVQLVTGKHQLIEFFAYWCPTCKSMAPVINGLEWKYQGRISFVYLDIDDPANQPFKKALGYKYQPHFFLIDGQGNILNQWLGYVPIENFEAVLMPMFPQ